MMTIKPVKAMRDLNLRGPSGSVFHLTEGAEYELHMGDASLSSRPERFYPCDIYPLGESEIVGTIDQREAGALIADGSLT